MFGTIDIYAVNVEGHFPVLRSVPGNKLRLQSQALPKKKLFVKYLHPLCPVSVLLKNIKIHLYMAHKLHPPPPPPPPFSLVWYTGLWIDRFGSVMTAMTFVLRINSWIVDPKIFQSGIVWFLSIEICWDVFCSNAYQLEPIHYHGHFSFIV